MRDAWPLQRSLENQSRCGINADEDEESDIGYNGYEPRSAEMILKKLLEAYRYLGATGTAVCLVGGSVMVAPIVIVVTNNIAWSKVSAYKEKISGAGIKVSYDFCEGNKEFIRRLNKSGQLAEIVVCTQKSRTKIGEVDYVMGVLSKASGINP